MDTGRLTLGIETSGWGGSVALARGGTVVARRSLDPAGRRHARTLVPEIQAVLADADVGPRQLDLVAVSIGPGSFTGLRVGVVCAKTLAWAARAAIVAVDTFLVIAEAAPPHVHRLQVVGDGQRGDLYVGRYVRDAGGRWERIGDIEIEAADAWLGRLGPDDVVTGPGLERHAAAAARICRLLPESLWAPEAASVALLGEVRAQRGATDDLWSLEPFYLRRSGAEEKADAAHGSGR